MKDKFDKLVKGVEEIKKNAGVAKQVIQQGVDTSKTVLKKAGEVINKDTVSTGIDVAAEGAKTVAGALEKASREMKKISSKLKQDKK